MLNDQWTAIIDRMLAVFSLFLNPNLEKKKHEKFRPSSPSGPPGPRAPATRWTPLPRSSRKTMSELEQQLEQQPEVESLFSA